MRAQLLLQVCKGVRSLHDRGLVHAEYAPLSVSHCRRCSIYVIAYHTMLHAQPYLQPV